MKVSQRTLRTAQALDHADTLAVCAELLRLRAEVRRLRSELRAIGGGLTCSGRQAETMTHLQHRAWMALTPRAGRSGK